MQAEGRPCSRAHPAAGTGLRDRLLSHPADPRVVLVEPRAREAEQQEHRGRGDGEARLAEPRRPRAASDRAARSRSLENVRGRRRCCPAGGVTSLSRQRRRRTRTSPACRRAAPASPARGRGRPRWCPASVSAANARAAGEQLVAQAPERPDVGPLIDRQAARLLGAHVARGADDSPASVPRGSRPAVGGSGVPSPPQVRLGHAEVQHLHAPGGVTLMLAGFRSRWTIPCSCAASQRVGDLAGAAERGGHGQRALAALRPPPARARGSRRRRTPRGRRSPRCSDG